jgi:hypothetical protein
MLEYLLDLYVDLHKHPYTNFNILEGTLKLIAVFCLKVLGDCMKLTDTRQETL